MAYSGSDADKALSPEQRRHVENWIRSHWTGSKSCPICQHSKWQFGEHVVQPLTQFPLGSFVVGGGPAYPAVLTICLTCGYTMAFNAVVMRLLATREGGADAGK